MGTLTCLKLDMCLSALLDWYLTLSDIESDKPEHAPYALEVGNSNLALKPSLLSPCIAVCMITVYMKAATV